MFRILAFFGVVMAIFVIGFLLIFGGHGKKATPPVSSTGVILKALPTYADSDAQVSLTMDGIVNGDDAHRAIKITVSRDQRELDVIQGYSGHKLSDQTFYNSPDAFAVFLRAINTGGFLNKLAKPASPNDDRGQCASGVRYIFELDQNGKVLSRLWGSDCGNNVGTLGGNAFYMRDLFQAQITNYSDLTQNVDLSM